MRRIAVAWTVGCLVLSGCRDEIPDDVSEVAPSTGIPRGAVGAVGVSFDLKPRPLAAGPTKGRLQPAPQPEAVADPFAEPPDTAAAPSACAPPPLALPKGTPHRPSSPLPTTETTL